MRGRRILAVGVAVLCMALSDNFAAAQAQGSKQIRIVVPFPPGGTADVIARLLGQQISQSGGPNVVIENRPGAGTIIATELVSRAPPDGGTLLLMANSFVINASVRASLPYDPLTSFDPVCLLVNSPQVLVVNSVVAVSFACGIRGGGKGKARCIVLRRGRARDDATHRR